jgi:hypothetical protein
MNDTSDFTFSSAKITDLANGPLDTPDAMMNWLKEITGKATGESQAADSNQAYDGYAIERQYGLSNEWITEQAVPKLKHWSDLLSRIQTIAPDAHIAGGAIRDVLRDNGTGEMIRTINDIDIFFGRKSTTSCEESKAEYDRAESILNLVNDEFDYKSGGIWCGRYEDFSDAIIWGSRRSKRDFSRPTVEHYQYTPLNFVWLNKALTPEENMARFDFGLCRVAFDGKRIITTPEYERDVRNHCLTMLRADDYHQFCYSMMRYTRLVKKRYLGRHLEFAPHLKDYYPRWLHEQLREHLPTVFAEPRFPFEYRA